MLVGHHGAETEHHLRPNGGRAPNDLKHLLRCNVSCLFPESGLLQHCGRLRQSGILAHLVDLRAHVWSHELASTLTVTARSVPGTAKSLVILQLEAAESEKRTCHALDSFHGSGF